MMHQFDSLSILVKEKFGIDPEALEGTFSPPPKVTVNISKEDIDDKIEIKYDGIFYKDDDGDLVKGFLYIKKGYNLGAVQRYNLKTIVPKFHIVSCSVIERQRANDNFDGHYVFSTQHVFMVDLDDEEKDLLLCKNCLKHIHEYETDDAELIKKVITTTEYEEIFIKNNEATGNFTREDIPRNYDLTLWGYTPDWDKLSKNYRLSMGYTCETCHIKLDGANGYYLDTHHISGNKTNNEDSNLRCLCVLCHANVDDIHRRNFSVGSNRKRLNHFINDFKTELINCQNPYLPSL